MLFVSDVKVKAILLCPLLLAAGCGSYCKIVEPDRTTGHFPTKTEVSAQSIKVRSKIDVNRFKSLLYIRNTSSPPAAPLDFFDFTKNAIGKLDFFKEIKDKQQIRVEMVADGTAADTYQVSDEMIVEWLKKKYGDFLIADYRLKSLGGFNFGFDFNIIEPSSGERVLSISHKGFNTSGLDQPVFYPVFNSISDWLRENAS